MASEYEHSTSKNQGLFRWDPINKTAIILEKKKRYNSDNISVIQRDQTETANMLSSGR